MRRSLALIAVAALLPVALVGCDPGALPEEGDSSQASTSEMQSLDQFGFTFALPDGFETYDAGMAFSAQRTAPVGFLTVEPFDGEAPAYDTYPAREGETLSIQMVGEVEVLVVENAALSGLPPGVSANELIVNNGGASFSLILSSDEAALGEAWSTVMDSATIAVSK